MQRFKFDLNQLILGRTIILNDVTLPMRDIGKVFQREHPLPFLVEECDSAVSTLKARQKNLYLNICCYLAGGVWWACTNGH